MSVKHKDDAGLDQLDPATTTARDATHFRRIIAAAKNVESARRELGEAVDAARAAGESWTIIGAALGVSKQAAYERFGQEGTQAARKAATKKSATKTTSRKLSPAAGRRHG